jgi:pimeloyl-ACP methyl ester carboxylesterase
MTIRSKTDPPREPVPTHSDEVVEVHERMLGDSSARGRHIEVRSGRRVPVIEAGEGPPVLFLHGSSTSSLSLLALLERLEGVRAIAVDRPGFGLSELVHVPRERFREAAIEFIDAKMLVRLMSSMGEKDTIVRYPDLIEALVAAGNDPIASAVNLAELRAAISPFGFRRSMRVHPDELRRLTVPTAIRSECPNSCPGSSAQEATGASIPAQRRLVGSLFRSNRNIRPRGDGETR